MVELVQDGKIVAFEQVPAIQWLRCGTSTRRCTFSSVEQAENVAEFAQLLRLNPTAMVFSHQIHSDTIELIDEKCPLQHVIALDGVDAMLTTLRDVMLTVFTADCVPVFFADVKKKVIGVAHSGWKGTGISLEALKRTSEGDPDDYEFILGPSIGPCCYQVDGERGKLFEDLYGTGSIEVRDNSFYLDLRNANVGILEKAGITNITVYKNCTCCDEKFYSFRGDGAKQFQLMLALIGYFR